MSTSLFIKARFEELVEHLTSYNAPMVVSLGEDAPYMVLLKGLIMIDELVGFTLPRDEPIDLLRHHQLCLPLRITS